MWPTGRPPPHPSAVRHEPSPPRRLRRSRSSAPLAFPLLVRANAALGHLTEAARLLTEERRYTIVDRRNQWHVYVAARLGQLREARRVMDAAPPDRTGRGPALSQGAALVAIGDIDGAFASLEASIATHVPSAIWMRVAPELDPLRGDPRFAALLARMRMPMQDEAWRIGGIARSADVSSVQRHTDRP